MSWGSNSLSTAANTIQGSTAAGAAGGFLAGGPIGAVAGGGTGYLNNMWSNNEQNRAQGQQANQNMWNGLNGVASQMQSAGQNYANTANANNVNYQSQMSGLVGQAGQAADNAKSVYGSVENNLTNLADQAQKNASGAMTLQQMEDPNNSVASGTRNLYNNEAQGMQDSGTANVGVMQALGAQSTAQQLGSMGVPVNGAQMQSMMAANQGQAGQAMANVQNQVNNLKTQGLQAGQAQSNFAYQQGQNAVGTAAGLQQDRQNANTQYQGVESGLRNEQGNYYGNEQNSANNAAGVGYSVAQNNANTQAGLLTGQTAATQAQLNANIARNNAPLQMIPGAMGAVGSLYGGSTGAGFQNMGNGVASAFGGNSGGYDQQPQPYQTAQYGGGGSGGSSSGMMGMAAMMA